MPATVGAVYKQAALREQGAQARDTALLLRLLRSEFDKIIASARWLSPASRTVAQKKLALMDFEIGGPEHVEALPWTVQQGDGWFNNSVHIAKALVSHQVQKLGRTQGRADWGQELGPMSVNAFYNVHANTLFVPAALLQQVSRVTRRPPSSLSPLPS